MWNTFGILCLLAVTTTVLCAPYPYKDSKVPRSEVSLYKRQALDKPYINIPAEEEDEQDDEDSDESSVGYEGDKDLEEEKDDEDEENKYSEEEEDEDSQGKEGPEEQNPEEVVLEVVKPPSFIENLFTWPPTFSWPPAFSWPSTLSWPTFALPSLSALSWPSFLGGRSRVAYPANYYYHYANYPNYPNYRYLSWNTDAYYSS